MTIIELANKLKKIYDQHGDIDVMLASPDADIDVYSVDDVVMLEAGEGEYPKDWDMPAGFKFVRIAN
jgi:esterase/lipase superfamily enzyme